MIAGADMWHSTGVDRLGMLESARMQNGFDFLKQAYDIDASISPDDIYTTEFLQ